MLYSTVLSAIPQHDSAMHVCAQSLASCPTLHDPMDCSPPGSSVPGILQARILECVAMPSSRWSSQPRDQTQVSCIFRTAGSFFSTKPQGSPIHTSPPSWSSLSPLPPSHLCCHKALVWVLWVTHLVYIQCCARLHAALSIRPTLSSRPHCPRVCSLCLSQLPPCKLAQQYRFSRFHIYICIVNTWDTF